MQNVSVEAPMICIFRRTFAQSVQIGLFAEPIGIVSRFHSPSKSKFWEIGMPQRPMKLLDQVRDAIRLKHYAYSTEKTYVYWAKRSVVYHDKRHPQEMGEKGS